MLIPPRILCATSRCCSGFVSRMRYVNRLRESDEACTAALQSAVIFLFHCLDPLLQRTEHRTFRTVQHRTSGTEPHRTLSTEPQVQNHTEPQAQNLRYRTTQNLKHRTSDLLSLLHTLGADPCLVEESVLIGCSADKQAQFCLDVGALQQAAVEGACEGTFTDLRKSFFLLSAAEAPLVAKGRALLHWHQTNAFCGATGEPTRRNRAGSQRASSGGGVVLYPKGRAWRRRCAGRWQRRWVWRCRGSPTAPLSTGPSHTAPSCWAATPLLAPPTHSCVSTTRSWRTLAGSAWTRSAPPCGFRLRPGEATPHSGSPPHTPSPAASSQSGPTPSRGDRLTFDPSACFLLMDG
ncbi:NAD(P)H pyrophosphatase NUDT13, mitochondrial isoform X2 [Genypterus blacodes]|uniref:NAD(P)H pyrophosphatase NUDT13, mitochondrial isoform X2 n=1 Tax=Genypterus blacodes TaxID=154954 RepID=UPI003F763849